MAGILQKDDDAQEFSLLQAIDDLRRSLAACHWCQSGVGNLMDTFTNDADTKFESRFHNTTCKVMDDISSLKNLSASSPQVKDKVNYDEIMICAENQMKMLKQKYVSVEKYKLGVVVSHVQSLYPADWEEFIVGPAHNREKTKDFINAKDTQRLGSTSGSFKMYVDSLFHVIAGCEWLAADSDLSLPLSKANAAIQDSRCALVGAKCAKTIYYKLPKLTDSADDKKKKRDFIRACKEAISTMELSEIFPKSVMAELNSA